VFVWTPFSAFNAHEGPSQAALEHPDFVERVAFVITGLPFSMSYQLVKWVQLVPCALLWSQPTSLAREGISDAQMRNITHPKMLTISNIVVPRWYLDTLWIDR
jgi:hypothetical protein